MKLLLYALAGVCGGVLAGMGMGGGTLTIPILVLLLSVDQLTAQFVNLIAFLPTGAAALGMHLKNKLVEPAALPYILIPALAATAATSFFAQSAAEWLGKLYGGFLVLIALFGLAGGVVRGARGEG
ncbi:MAG TPA: TSUP family transporter [Candidatus Limadaptatus stercoravium]|nr:TSUP family transporter [Candidatus Limadaptatus stercoravium]